MNIYQIKPECKGTKIFKELLLVVALLVFYIIGAQPTLAIVDPLSSPNNKYGIHIISPTSDESSPAASLVNSSGGDWGYITVLIESHNRDHNKWQNFFNDLRRRHLIPLVRLATQPQGPPAGGWKIPYDGEEVAWADFLDNLNWPTKNRYIIIYNEPNQGQEWEGKVDPASYARVLDKTITALKNKNPDFFVLNAGFDASAPSKSPSYLDEWSFLKQMDQEVPGIFSRLDGWVSHSYPNPGFVGSPRGYGKGTVRTWQWELQLLKSFGIERNLPVFITETGWKHSDGLHFDKSLPSPQTVGEYYKTAFEDAWNQTQIVAVTPFLLTYQQPPFDHFSFKKITGEIQNIKILGVSYPDYYPQYQTISELSKISGKPYQESQARLTKGEVYQSIVAGESYSINLTFKNVGQSIWGEQGEITLKPLIGEQELGIKSSPLKLKVEPGQEAVFNMTFQAPQSGIFRVSLQLYQADTPFDQPSLEFNTEVKPPVILSVTSSLKWKQDFSGQYILVASSDSINEQSSSTNEQSSSTNEQIKITLDKGGQSLTEARQLLPDYSFKFTINKPYYKPKTIEAKLHSGINNLNFGELEPDFISAILKPPELWKLLPFSK